MTNEKGAVEGEEKKGVRRDSWLGHVIGEECNGGSSGSDRPAPGRLYLLQLCMGGQVTRNLCPRLRESHGQAHMGVMGSWGGRQGRRSRVGW